MKTRLAAVLLLVLATRPVTASDRPGLSPDSELFKTVAALDAAMFDAFNRCELDKLGAYFADDVEFYHDNDGLSRGRQAFLDAVKANICGKMTRELVKSSLEVHPLKGFGALEIGVHRFHHPSLGAADVVGEGRFVHVWEKKGEVWRITRVMSFDHHAAAKLASPVF